MGIDHETWVIIAKSYGLFYMMAIFIAAVIYACWPGNKEKFEQAANNILKGDEEQ